MPIPSMPRNAPFALSSAVLCAALCVSSPTLHAQSAPTAPAPAKGATPTTARPTLTVSVTQPQTADWPVFIDASGAVMPWQEASIGARSAGQPLAEVLVSVGDTVKRGQVVARFDDTALRTDLAQAEASLAQAQAQAVQAIANRDRALQLKGTGSISEQDILMHTTQASTAEAQVGQAKAVLAAARLKLEYARVTAPDDGVISARTATLGAVPQPGAELFKLIRQNRLEWRAEVPPAQLGRIKIGATAQVTLPDGAVVNAKVRQHGATLDSSTRLGIVFLDLQPGTSARAAMYVNGRITLERKPALVIPSDAVVIRDGRSFVFMQEGERVRQLSVTLGRREGNKVEVLSGLSAEQKVVTRGAGFLNDNDVVRVVAASAS